MAIDKDETWTTKNAHLNVIQRWETPQALLDHLWKLCQRGIVELTADKENQRFIVRYTVNHG